MQWSGKDPNEVFAKEELLGEGAYGAVYRAVHRETDMVIAIKELPNLVNQEELQKEIDILKKVYLSIDLSIYLSIYLSRQCVRNIPILSC
jgi:serine/threonine protein kinase